jgi:hypothetical protein
MARDMKYLEKALTVVLDDDEHGRLGLSWDHIRSIRSVAAPRDSVIRCSFYTLQPLCEKETLKDNDF